MSRVVCHCMMVRAHASDPQMCVCTTCVWGDSCVTSLPKFSPPFKSLEPLATSLPIDLARITPGRICIMGTGGSKKKIAKAGEFALEMCRWGSRWQSLVYFFARCWTVGALDVYLPCFSHIMIMKSI